MAEEKQTRIFHMQPGANYYEAVTIYNSGEGVINLGEAIKKNSNANSNSNLNSNSNSNSNLSNSSNLSNPSQHLQAIRELVDKGAELVLPDFLARYRAFWNRVLADEDFIAAFKVQAPHGFYGGYNKKLFCNMLGFLKEQHFFSVRSSEVLGKHFYENAVKKYISNFGPRDGGTDTCLTDSLLKKLKSFV